MVIDIPNTVFSVCVVTYVVTSCTYFVILLSVDVLSSELPVGNVIFMSELM